MKCSGGARWRKFAKRPSSDGRIISSLATVLSVLGSRVDEENELFGCTAELTEETCTRRLSVAFDLALLLVKDSNRIIC